MNAKQSVPKEDMKNCHVIPCLGDEWDNIKQSIARLRALSLDMSNLLFAIHGHAELIVNDLDPTSPRIDSSSSIKNAAERLMVVGKQILADTGALSESFQKMERAFCKQGAKNIQQGKCSDETSGSPVPKPATILVIHGDRGMVSAFSAFLPALGYTILGAYNSMEGLEAYRSSKPDIVITALRLRPEHGPWVVEQIRAQDKRTPIMILAPYGEIDALTNFYKMGGDDFVKIPFKVEDLIQRIGTLVGLNQRQLEDRRAKKLAGE